MTRQHFLKLVALTLGGALLPLNALTTIRRAPAFFVGHGSPMIGIEENNFTRSLKALGKTLEQPKAILVVSAHWIPPFYGISVHRSSALMYDFFGFPEPLYQVQYPAPNADFLTPEIEAIVPEVTLKERSLDHGAWTVLKHLYPDANIPVMQFGINRNLSLREHYEIGQKLNSLRDHGVMIIGSGNVTHNLSRVDPSPNAPIQEWAEAFDAYIKNGIESRDIHTLIGFREAAPYAEIAHPTLEHYIPLLYVAGCMREEDKSTFPYEGFSHGSLSMRNWLLNDKSIT